MLDSEDLGLDEFIDSLPYVVKKIKLGVDGIEVVFGVKYFSHVHACMTN